MFLQQLVNGSVVGATYALFALGFTLMFGVLGVVNLTYGVYFSVGAFLALFGTKTLALPIWLALPGSAIVTGLIAIVVDWLLLTRLRAAKAPELASLMVTLGATLLLYSLATAWLGTEIRRLPNGLISTASLGGDLVRISASQLLIVVTALAVVGGLFLILKKSPLGYAIRALADNGDAAQLMGINTKAVVCLVSFISGAFGAIAGVLVGLNYNAVQPYMGETMMLKGFAVIILGGLGDIRGALIAGFTIGIFETFVAGYAASSLKDAVGFAVLVLVLWVRPEGLLGRSPVRRI
jgi:branched-chain amino acid transport system permease protein